jgi:two-component system KDP operon response regulator KdpE
MSDFIGIALLVEDEPHIRRFVRGALEQEGWQVHESATLARGLTEAATRKPDLIILDLGLPDGDGVDFISDLRTWSAVPVIVLSARVDEAEKIRALDRGADDYLTKPFGVGELLARVRASRRRQRGPATGGDGTVRFGDVVVDVQNRQVTKGGQPVRLTPTEHRLLAALVANPGKVMTTLQLLRTVWGPHQAENAHYLRIYMGHLRHKLEDDPAQPRFMITETGVGYRFQLG